MLYRLPEPDPKLVESAISVYRTAALHAHRIDAKWEGRDIYGYDEFHRTRVTHENDNYYAEHLLREAENLLLAVLGDRHVFPRDQFVGKRIKAQRNEVRVVAKAIDNLRKRIGTCACAACRTWIANEVRNV